MPLHIGLLLFPQVQQLDFTGPYEIFATLPDTKVHLVCKEVVPVISATGLIFTPDMAMADCPQLDVLCIPGGAGVNALLKDEEVIAFIRQQAAAAKYVTSVCTGALVLGAAGLLQGRRATTHWASHHFLARYGAIPVRERVVRDGNLFTGGGVTAGIDFALTLAAELCGRDAAEAVQLALEYAPAPPFDAGTPETAPPQVLAAVRAGLAATLAKRQALMPA